MLKIFPAALFVLIAGGAWAEQGETMVQTPELPLPVSDADDVSTDAPPSAPVPQATVPAPESEADQERQPEIHRPSEIQRSDERPSKRVAAFWFIIPGR